MWLYESDNNRAQWHAHFTHVHDHTASFPSFCVSGKIALYLLNAVQLGGYDCEPLRGVQLLTARDVLLQPGQRREHCLFPDRTSPRTLRLFASYNAFDSRSGAPLLPNSLPIEVKEGSLRGLIYLFL